MTRTPIRLAFVGIALLLVASSLPLHGGTATAARNSFVVEQGGRCVEVTPLSGNEDVVSFYDYRNPENYDGPTGYTYSSYMPRHLQREDVSRLFLYEGPNGVSIVMVHNEVGSDDGDGSAATFRFQGLPSGGSWAVVDDSYQGRDDRSSRNRIDWMWYGSRTDGGAFRGVDSQGVRVTIDPAFNEDAALYDEYDRTGRIRAWQFLTGSLDSPGTVGLDMSRPVTIRTGNCGHDETPPNAALSAGSGVAGHGVTLDASGSTDDRNVAAYRWDFDGDGHVDRETTAPTVSHAYQSAGTYHATVTVVDEAENTASASANVTVEPDDPPNAAFDVGDSPTEGFPVRFDAGGSTDDVAVAEYRWDFDGDGEVDRRTSDPAIAWTYDAAGSYGVSLTVVDSGGNNATVTRTVTVDADDPPDAGFSVETAHDPVEGEQVVFNASEATDDTGIASYRWSFGDGGTRTGERVSYSYAENGTYTVTLEVIDQGDNNATARTRVEVLPPDETPPTARATANPRRVEAGENVSFDAGGSSDDRYVASRHWEFGDGNAANGETATHAYGSAGTYDATVAVTDGGGNTATDNVTVEVRPGRPPNVSASIPETVTVGESFEAEASATDGGSGAARYDWNFAGTTKSGQRVTHAFEERGEYTVTVRATDRAGHANATTATVTVLPPDTTPPTATLTASESEVREGTEVTFDASNATDDRGLAAYRWDFDGDGEVDRETESATVGYAYSDSGTYNATVTVVDGGDNTDTATVAVAVEERRRAHGGGGGGSSGGSTSVGPPPVVTDVERTSTNAGLVDVRNGRADEPIRSSLPESAAAAETGVRFRSVTVDLSADDPHFAVETTRPAETSLPADVTLGSLAVDSKYVEPGRVENVTFEVAISARRLSEAGLEPGDLTAYRYANDTWEAVDASVERRSGTVALRVRTDEFVPIAVGGERSVTLADAELDAEAVSADEPVSVTATLRNEGEDAETFTVNLTVNGAVAAARTVEVPGGETRTVTVETALDPGTYDVGLGDRQLGSVTVAEPVAELEVAGVTLNESTIAAGERVEITATVENTGSKAGERTVALTLFGERVASKTVAVAPGETKAVTFVRRVDAAGTYAATVGDETAALTVTEATEDPGEFDASAVPVAGFGVAAALVALLAAVALVRVRGRGR